MNWRFLSTVILLAAAALTGWAWWSQRDKPATAAKQTRPDYVLTDFNVVVLNKEGRESFTLRAPQLTRNPADKTMDIVTPLFLIPPRTGGNGGPWEVRSQRGWVNGEGDEVRLRGQVKADSTNANGKPINIATEQLNVFPDANRATSDVQVQMIQPGTILTGQAMEADLDSKNINLKDVKVRYEAKAR